MFRTKMAAIDDKSPVRMSDEQDDLLTGRCLSGYIRGSQRLQHAEKQSSSSCLKTELRWVSEQGSLEWQAEGSGFNPERTQHFSCRHPSAKHHISYFMTCILIHLSREVLAQFINCKL